MKPYSETHQTVNKSGRAELWESFRIDLDGINANNAGCRTCTISTELLNVARENAFAVNALIATGNVETETEFVFTYDMNDEAGFGGGGTTGARVEAFDMELNGKVRRVQITKRGGFVLKGIVRGSKTLTAADVTKLAESPTHVGVFDCTQKHTGKRYTIGGIVLSNMDDKRQAVLTRDACGLDVVTVQTGSVGRKEERDQAVRRPDMSAEERASLTFDVLEGNRANVKRSATRNATKRERKAAAAHAHNTARVVNAAAASAK